MACTATTTITVCQSCDQEVSSASLTTHGTTCPDMIIPCTQSSNGCTWIGPRRNLADSHISVCPYEAIKGFFSIAEARTVKLVEENESLRQKLMAMEGMTQIIRSELDAVKTTLGPWYRLERAYERPIVSQRPSYAQSGHNIRDDIPPMPAPSGGDQSVQPSQGFPDVPSSLNRPPYSDVDIASYFPPALAESSSSQQAYESRQNFQPPPSLDAYASRSPPASSSQGNAFDSTSTMPIAPLNLSTTLPGTLSSMHSSLETLASSHDTLRHLTELAISSEAARTSEELGALRAVVNGLRMHVHAMMMDRNTNAMYSAASPSPLGGFMSEEERNRSAGWTLPPRFYPLPHPLPSPGSGPSHPSHSSSSTSITKL